MISPLPPYRDLQFVFGFIVNMAAVSGAALDVAEDFARGREGANGPGGGEGSSP
jgi:hypothetical protein